MSRYIDVEPLEKALKMNVNGFKHEGSNYAWRRLLPLGRKKNGMKKIIGYILLALFFALLYAGETLIFILGDCHWAVIVFAPIGTFVGAALIIGFMELVERLID